MASGLILHRGNEPPWPLVNAFVPLNASEEISNFFIGWLYLGENALVPLLFQNRSIQACVMSLNFLL